jgi:phosphopantetheine adenylyltransferase
MAEFALTSNTDFVICDFVAPLEEMRKNFNADWTIWMDSIEHSRFEDTNKAFVSPVEYDFRITEKNAEKWVPFVGDFILKNKRRSKFDWRKETVQLLGRWQPWHAGHRALFEEAIKKTGQVCIMIRDCNGWQNSNPFEIDQVTNFIKKDLDPLYQGQYTIQVVPNIVEIVYGRDVGYKITQIELNPEIQKISGTEIRKEMKEKGLL